MPYRFESTASAQENFRAVALGQLDRAISELTKGVAADPVEAVHNARKALKKERSLLRLARGAVGSRARRRANARLRDVGRRLSGARDADVMLEALDNLAERYVGQLPRATFTAIHARLQHARDTQRADEGTSGSRAAAITELQAIRQEIGDWTVRGDGIGALTGGLPRTYRRGRRAMRQAEQAPTVERLHAWRKRVKDLWYHLRLLEPAAPYSLGGQVREAHALADLLGHDHDLAVLREAIAEMAPDLALDHEAVIALLDHRRQQLQEEAFIVGRRLYAEKPDAFRRRLRRYLKGAELAQRVRAARDAAEAASLVTQPHPS